VVFDLDRQRYAVALGVVERVLPMVAVSPLPSGPGIALGVVNVHGQVVPVLDLRRRLGFEPREYGLTAHLLLARTPRRLVALPVDEVLGVTTVPEDAVTPADTTLPGTRQVAGIAALPDGLLFIHDVDGFLSLEEEQRLTAAIEAAAP
jgi:purine-binding chemotaxis protein CheW